MYDINYKIIKQELSVNLRKDLAQTFNGQNKLYVKS